MLRSRSSATAFGLSFGLLVGVLTSASILLIANDWNLNSISINWVQGSVLIAIVVNNAVIGMLVGMFWQDLCDLWNFRHR